MADTMENTTGSTTGNIRKPVIVLAVLGLLAAWVLVLVLSPGAEQPGETDTAIATADVTESAPPQPAVAAMTEESIFDFFADMKNDPAPPPGRGPHAVWQPPVDFDALRAFNADVYAWIMVPGTPIDYPVLQHPDDDSRYLNYNIDGSFGLPGCIYTEGMNGTDFTDPHTVIYGHNMKNGTMFGGLHRYRDAEFFRENRDIIIYTPERELHYEIFAAHEYDDRHLLHSFDFDDPGVFAAYLEGVLATRDMGANMDRAANVTADDKIITLATCVSGRDDQRYLVQAVLRTDATHP